MPMLVTVAGTLEVGQGMLHIIELPELFLISPPDGNVKVPLESKVQDLAVLT